MKTYEEMTAEVVEKARKEKSRRRGAARRITSVALSLVFVVGLIAVAGYSGSLSRPAAPAAVVPGPAAVTAGVISAVKSYGELFDLLKTVGDSEQETENVKYKGARSDYDLTAEVAVANKTEEEVLSPGDPEMAGGDYSGTNVQVAGIDEADVIKTDGKYVYAVSRENVYIVSAENGDMQIVSKIPIGAENGADFTANSPLLPYQGTADIYAEGDRLVIVLRTYEPAEDQNAVSPAIDGWCGFSLYGIGRQYYTAAVYDISNKSAPSFLSAISVSGDGLSSRMTDGKLYLAATDRIYGDFDREDPNTFIPSTYEDGQKELVSPGMIYCEDRETECTYLNLTEIDVATASEVSSLSLLGYDGDIMYQSADNIFVARTDYQWSESSEESDDGVITESYSDRSETVIAKISVSGGLSLVGSARVDGYLHDSFSMDEYDGYLRAVTSVRDEKWTTSWREPENAEELESYIARARGQGGEYVEYYPLYEREIVDENSQSEMYNNLYVFDSAMNVTGKIEGLARDERIYSCRFEGPDGYFVTYRETDPLFHVDLSDPANPRVIDELKIPGHSDYLERFGDLLFGFGQTDEGELKLSMFSEDGNGAMSEIAVTVIPGADFSEALYDHHAILADADRGIICFGATGWWDDQTFECKTAYFIVRWNGQSFEIGMRADVAGWTEAMRGFYIGDYFYLFVRGGEKADGITSYSLSSFEKIASVEMDENAEPEYFVKNEIID